MNASGGGYAFGLLRSLVLYWRPGRQRALRRLYRPLVAEGALVFDIGAHLGDRTRAFARLGARVVALEPQPHLYRWLHRLLGSRARIILRPEAVGATAGEAMLAVSRRTPTVSTLSTDWQRGLGQRNSAFRHVTWNEQVRVPVLTLDQLIAIYGRPDFCKIDVEGFEAEVLAGLSQPLPALSLEFVAGALPIAEACVRRLGELGHYEFNVLRGEQREYLFAAWEAADILLEWLDAGAEDIASGDIYARLVPEPRANAASEGNRGPLRQPSPRSKANTVNGMTKNKDEE